MTSSSSPCEIFKTTKQMSSSNTPPMKLETVRRFCQVVLLLIADLDFSVKAYGELPENAKINETDTFGDNEDECAFEFRDGEVDIDDI